MKPASTTRSGSYDGHRRGQRARPSRSRLGKSRTRCTKVGMPARSARASPSMSSRSAPTATTWAPYAGSAAASSRAWRLVPEPETRTTRRAGVGGHARQSRSGRRGVAVAVSGVVPPGAATSVMTSPPTRPPMPNAVMACTARRTRTARRPASGPGPTAPPASAGEQRRAARRRARRRRSRAGRPRPSAASGGAAAAGRRRRRRPAAGTPISAGRPGRGRAVVGQRRQQREQRAAARARPRSARRGCAAPTAKPGPEQVGSRRRPRRSGSDRGRQHGVDAWRPRRRCAAATSR